MTIIDELLKSLVEGGQYALAALGWAAWWWERRQTKEMGRQVLKLATAQIAATVKHEQTIHANTSVMERMLSRQ
jgi:hypothetical protein